MLNILLRTMTVMVLQLRNGYWLVTGITAKKEKPPIKNGFSLQSSVGWIASWALEVMIFLQLIGIFVVLPVSHALGILQVLGVVVCLVGVTICFLARYALGTNWSHAADYQIKTEHTLVTYGIYQYVRHPIYLGLALSWIGAEMVAGSYLFISFLALFFVFYVQGKREEKILRAHFGVVYKNYMKHTKMLIPFVV